MNDSNKEFIEQQKSRKDPTKEISKNIQEMEKDDELNKVSKKFLELSTKYSYSYNFKWLGRPIIQYPQDIIALQEIIWETKPDLIIETGIAHGGSLIFYSSILELIGDEGMVLGIDIDIREHNRKAIEEHPMNKRITMIEGSSISEETFEKVKNVANNFSKIMVCLDSNHTHEHVLKELELYSSLVTKGLYLVVFDTLVEDMPENYVQNRPWGKGNNPKTAIWKFLEKNKRFKINNEIHNKLQITVTFDGYLECVEDP